MGIVQNMVLVIIILYACVDEQKYVHKTTLLTYWQRKQYSLQNYYQLSIEEGMKYLQTFDWQVNNNKTTKTFCWEPTPSI